MLTDRGLEKLAKRMKEEGCDKVDPIFYILYLPLIILVSLICARVCYVSLLDLWNSYN